MTRSTTNRNDRGNTTARRRRREWLVAEFGDGTTVQCSTCDTLLTVETVTADRYPVAGVDGGRYIRTNIRPMCGRCNSSSGGRRGAARRQLKGPTP